MLYKQNVLTLQTTVNIFLGMDVMTKGIFTNLLLGTREVHRSPTSALGSLTKKVFRVHPLETNVSPHVLEELKERSQRTDEVVPVYQSDFSTTEVHYVPTMDTIYEKGEPKESSVLKKLLSSVHSKSKRPSYAPEIFITDYSTTS